MKYYIIIITLIIDKDIVLRKLRILINLLKINQLPIDGDEKLTKKEQYNEIKQ